MTLAFCGIFSDFSGGLEVVEDDAGYVEIIMVYDSSIDVLFWSLN